MRCIFQSNAKMLQNGRFQVHILERRGFGGLPVEKHENEFGASQQRVKLPFTVATQANLPRFRLSQMKTRNSPKSAKPSALVSSISCQIKVVSNKRPFFGLIPKVSCFASHTDLFVGYGAILSPD